MRFKEYLLTEGFFDNIFDITKEEAGKLAMHYGLNWGKSGNIWTMHKDEDHLFTYNVKKEELMSDKSKQELLKVVSFK